ncbi:MAG: hypothetical protein CMB80_18585 [Flammeovirgaceae bacterium]|nr:hypothetical protein [Flammeovirgaceae bacterium]MBR08579.1 hypothetical protein [Rickettsiales bacterium]HCX20603.1 hypothetical protein [Cytophagales bacterium]
MIRTKSLHILWLSFIRLILPIGSALLFAITPSEKPFTQLTNAKNVTAENIRSEKIIRAFEKVVERYHSLHDYEIVLVQAPIKESTMQAQPIVGMDNLFNGVKKYQVKIGEFVRDSDTRLEDLSEDILMGWFAHELGHLVDYQPHSNFEMIEFGIKYMWYDDFKTKVEHAADQIAIKYGFKKEILASKRFLLESEFKDSSYQDKIKQYYLPIEEIESIEEDNISGI